MRKDLEQALNLIKQGRRVQGFAANPFREAVTEVGVVMEVRIVKDGVYEVAFLKIGCGPRLYRRIGNEEETKSFLSEWKWRPVLCLDDRGAWVNMSACSKPPRRTTKQAVRQIFTAAFLCIGAVFVCVGEPRGLYIPFAIRLAVVIGVLISFAILCWENKI
jgi:hypothetical protein